MRIRVLGGVDVLDDNGDRVQLTAWQRRFLAVLVLQEPSFTDPGDAAPGSAVVTDDTLRKFGLTWNKAEGSRLRTKLPGFLPRRLTKETGYRLVGAPDVDLWEFRRHWVEANQAASRSLHREAAHAFLAAEACWPDASPDAHPFGEADPTYKRLVEAGARLQAQRQLSRVGWFRARWADGEMTGTVEMLERWVRASSGPDPELDRELMKALLAATGYEHGRHAIEARREELSTMFGEAAPTPSDLDLIWADVEQLRQKVARVPEKATVALVPARDPQPTGIPNLANWRLAARRHRVALLAIMAVLLGAAAAAGSVFLRSSSTQARPGRRLLAQAVPPITFQKEGEGYEGVYVINADGSGERRLTSLRDSFPVRSPDGAHIAFKRAVENSDQLYAMDADGSNLTRLTDTFARESFPSWSPDGRKIVFKSNRAGHDEIWVIDSDGSHPTRLTETTTKDSYPAWSPEGTRIAYTTQRDGNSEVYVMGVDGSHQTRVSNNPAKDEFPHWSPDGRLILFTSNRDGNDEVYVMAADGTGQRNLSNNIGGDFGAVWSPDGTQIAFQSNRDGMNQIYVMNPDGSQQRRITNGPAPCTFPAWGVA